MTHQSEPIIVACPADTWVLVVGAVTSATLYKMSVTPNLYLQTYRLRGDPPPVNNADAAVAFIGDDLYASVSSDALIDVYIKAVGKDGQLRVDL